MKAKTFKVDVEVRLILSGREMQILNHMMSYDNKNSFVEGMVSSHYNGGVTKKEMLEVLDKLKCETEKFIKHFEAGKGLLLQTH